MLEAYLSLAGMALLLLGSPGPAPLAIAATGAIFGYRKGLLFVAGLLAGLVVVLGLEIWGLTTLFKRFPELQWYVQMFGLGYLVYLAWKLGSAPIQTTKTTSSRPPTFWDGLVLNVTNPKAYAAVLVVYAQFLLPYTDIYLAYLMTALVCLVVVTLIDLLWLLLGQVLRPVFNHPRAGRWLRLLFAALMLGSVILVLFWS